jgi:hypothetical protein
MSRAALIALLVASALGGSLYAQRGGARFHGNVARPAHSGFAGRGGFPSKRFLKPLSLQDGSHRRDALGSYFAPYGDLFGDERPDGEAVMNEVTSPSVVHEDRNPLHTSP